MQVHSGEGALVCKLNNTLLVNCFFVFLLALTPALCYQPIQFIDVYSATKIVPFSPAHAHKLINDSGPVGAGKDPNIAELLNVPLVSLEPASRHI